MYFVLLITTNAFLVSLPSVASSSHSIVDQAAQALAINQAKLSSAALKLFIDQLIASKFIAKSLCLRFLSRDFLSLPNSSTLKFSL